MNGPPVRVCFVIQKLLGLSGGAERIFLQTATAMAARGMAVDLLIYDNGSGTPSFDSAGLPVTNLFPEMLKRRRGEQGNATPQAIRQLPHGGLMGHLKWAATHGLFEQRLTTALRKHRPDVVVAFLPPAITAAVRAGQRLGIPVIASTHNVPEEDFGDSPRWDQNPVYRKRARAALRQTAAITVLQNEFRDWFTPEEQSRICVMPNPISRLPVPVKIALPREKLVLAVGRLTPVKRFDLLIAAWEKIHAAYPDWRVNIYGEGPDHAALSAQITAAGLCDSVKLCGVTDALGPIYDRASLLCHPATFEGFGLVVAEAMAHGTPALAFANCAGVNTLIDNGVNGVLLDVGDDRVATLAAGLQQALKNPEYLRDLGSCAAAITQTYSPEKVAKQWDALIKKTALQS